MKIKKWTITLGICILAALFAAGCGSGENTPAEGRVLMEQSTAPWTQTLEKACGIKAFGKPQGAVKETLQEKDESYILTFEIDDEMTQELVDGYAQSVWRACEKASTQSNRSSSGYVYASMDQAEKRQEPLSYYIWYYQIDKQKFRVGIYSTNMEEGRPGGLVLKIEKW